MSGTSIALTDEEYYLLRELIEAQFGIYFAESTRVILQARLKPRVHALHLSSFMDYFMTLQFDGDGEMQRLATFITNNETYFYREPKHFSALFEHGLEMLEPNLAVSGKLRVLCAGCSSGEEPYTLNFVRRDQMRWSRLEVHIDAFDLDEERVEMARRGECRPRSLKEMHEDQVRRYLDRTGENQYEIKPRYREGVAFSSGNIVELDTFQKSMPYDVVFCRNVLIYFSESALRQAIENFAEVLRPGGLLFLGHSESIIGMSQRFETVRVGQCLAYRRSRR